MKGRFYIMVKKLTNKEKQILREDIKDLKWLAERYKAEGKLNKSADCESEMNKLQKRLRGEEDGISVA